VRSAGGAAGDLEVQLRAGRGAPVPVRVVDGFDVARLQQLFAVLQRRTGAAGASTGGPSKGPTSEAEAVVRPGRSDSKPGVSITGTGITGNNQGGFHDAHHQRGRSAPSVNPTNGGLLRAAEPSPAPLAAAADSVRRKAPVQRDAAWQRRQEEMQARLKAALEGNLRPEFMPANVWTGLTGCDVLHSCVGTTWQDKLCYDRRPLLLAGSCTTLLPASFLFRTCSLRRTHNRRRTDVDSRRCGRR
jgi:hypothetical protein